MRAMPVSGDEAHLALPDHARDPGRSPHRRGQDRNVRREKQLTRFGGGRRVVDVQSLSNRSGPGDVLAATRAMASEVGNLEPRDIYPDYPAPIVRHGEDRDAC